MKNTQAHIVLIEDEKQIRRFLRMTLEAEGIRIHEADTGKQGLADIGTYQPDLVILDLGLPDMDGVEVIRQLRTWSSVPILVLSARSEEMQQGERNAICAACHEYSRAIHMARLHQFDAFHKGVDGHTLTRQMMI